MLCSCGKRAITTLRKLPTIRPKTASPAEKTRFRSNSGTLTFTVYPDNTSLATSSADQSTQTIHLAVNEVGRALRLGLKVAPVPQPLHVRRTHLLPASRQ